MANKLPDSGPISMLDVYNVFNPPMNPEDYDYYFETIQDFKDRRDQILIENNNDLSQKTFGFGDDVSNLFHAFDGTEIISTPKMIFSRNITNFYGCFYECPKLEIISQELFYNCPNVVNFNMCFYRCESLTAIPERLFDNCHNVIDFGYCFCNCFKITTVPKGLFDNCPSVIDFSHCFYDCSKLITVPKDLFDNCPNVTNIDYCFHSCSEITSALPDVLNKQKFPKVTYSYRYAYECVKAANYNEIPSNFGGPSTNPPVTLNENTINNTKSLVNNIRTVNIPTSPISLNDIDFRELAGISNGQISLRDFYGKSTELKPQDCDYYFETEDDFWNRIENIIVENNGDFINKTFGFGDSVLSISHGFLQDTRVISTPKMIVSNNIIKVNSLFEMSGVIKISEKLFDNSKNIEDASLLFSSLENNDAIVELPENLLRNLTELNDLEDAFSGNNIVNIPNNFFANNKKVSTLYTTFSYTNIITIPEDLFVNTNITSVYMCFYTCRKLKTIPQNLFSRNPNINEFVSCFEDCSSITSAVPELWKTHPNANGTDCFKGCVNAANYNDIPSSWGGPA